MRSCPGRVMCGNANGSKHPLKYRRWWRNGQLFERELINEIYVDRSLWSGEGRVAQPLNVVLLMVNRGLGCDEMVRVGLEMPVNDVRMVIVVRSREMTVLRRQER